MFWNLVIQQMTSAAGEVVHDSLVGELGERVEANRLRGGQLSLRHQRLDLVRDRLASAEVVGGLDDRGDALPARNFAEGRAADDGRHGNRRDCHGDDCLAHGARRIELSVHCGFLLLWFLVLHIAPVTCRR